MPWGWATALALFFGGLGGGAFITAAWTSFLTGDRFKDILKFGAYVGVVAAVACIGFFAIELPTPERTVYLYTNPDSMIRFGSTVLSIIIPGGIVYATFLPPESLPWLKLFLPWSEYRKARNVVEIVMFLLGVGLISYTGIVLGVTFSKPFWSTPMLTILFFCSGMSTAMMSIGVCISVLYPTTTVEASKKLLVETLHRLDLADASMVLLEILALTLYMIEMIYGESLVAAGAAYELIWGSISTFFWGFVILGLLVPLIVVLFLAWRGRSKAYIRFYPTLMIIAGICALAGGIVMRYMILYAGQLVVLT